MKTAIKNTSEERRIMEQKNFPDLDSIKTLSTDELNELKGGHHATRKEIKQNEWKYGGPF